jgi:lipoprotein-releasing system permease protein
MGRSARIAGARLNPKDGLLMYKFLLCWRYLRTRYIALVCIISVMLGVATLIVVNAVMHGFTVRMAGEMNSMVGDLTLKVHSVDGALDPQRHMDVIRREAGEQIDGMSPTLVVYAMMYMQLPNGNLTRGVWLIGIDEKTYGSVSQVGRFLRHPAHRQQMSFDLPEGGYDEVDVDSIGVARDKSARTELAESGMAYRRAKYAEARRIREAYRRAHAAQQPPVAASVPAPATLPADPFAQASAATAGAADAEPDLETEAKPHAGIVLALGECSHRDQLGGNRMHIRPGDDVILAMATATLPPDVMSDKVTVVDVYDDPMRIDNESFAFVPLDHLQRARNMVDPLTGIGRFTTIQIKLKPGADLVAVRDKLRVLFDPSIYTITTWQEDHGVLLAAIHQEKIVLNILLFFIIAVAGFGILSIFSMIVMEKTRDIGILKSMGASAWGIMGIFLSYGLTLGLIGAGVGVGLGLLISANINEVKEFIERLTNAPLFDQSVYLFDSLPSVVQPWMVVIVATGAVLIAVLSSVLPACRAAMLHPVKALRFE